MTIQLRALLIAFLLAFPFTPASAQDEYAETIKVFRGAGESAKLFGNAYGYAVFPTIGKGGIGIGGAHGSGRVYQKGTYVGDTSMTQLTVGLQFGGQAYSQIIFFQNKQAFDNFTSGNFEFGAQATAVAIKSSAGAQAGTTGTSSGASSTGKAGSASTAGGYYGGMAVFTIAKGGLMYEASIGGQKFSYEAKGAKKK